MGIKVDPNNYLEGNYDGEILQNRHYRWRRM